MAAHWGESSIRFRPIEKNHEMVQTSNRSDVPSAQLGSDTLPGGQRGILEPNSHSRDLDLTHLSGSGTDQSNGLIEIAYSPQAAKASRARDSRQQGSSEDLNTALSHLSADAAKTMDAAHRAEFMNELHGFLSQAKLKNLSDDEIVRTLGQPQSCWKALAKNRLTNSIAWRWQQA